MLKYDDVLVDGFVDDLGGGKVRVWNAAGKYWVTQSKNRLDKDYDNFKLPVVCPVCKRFMAVDIDRKYWFKYKACFNCYIYFIEDREDKWKPGRDLTEEEMKKYDEWRQKRS